MMFLICAGVPVILGVDPVKTSIIAVFFAAYFYRLTNRVYMRFYELSTAFPHFTNPTTGIRYLGYHVDLSVPDYVKTLPNDVTIYGQSIRDESPLTVRQLEVSWKFFLRSVYRGDPSSELMTKEHARELAKEMVGVNGHPVVLGVGTNTRSMDMVMRIDWESEEYSIKGHPLDYTRWTAILNNSGDHPIFMNMTDPDKLIEFPFEVSIFKQGKQMARHQSALELFAREMGNLTLKN